MRRLSKADEKYIQRYAAGRVFDADLQKRFGPLAPDPVELNGHPFNKIAQQVKEPSRR